MTFDVLMGLSLQTSPLGTDDAILTETLKEFAKHLDEVCILFTMTRYVFYLL